MSVQFAIIGTALAIIGVDELPSLAELQDTWRRYERECCRRLLGTVRYTTSTPSEMITDYVVIYEIKQLERCFVYARNDGGKREDVVQLTGRNSKYGFTLTRESASGPWRYTSSHLVATSPQRYQVEARRIAYLTRLPLYLYDTEASYVPGMLGDPETRFEFTKRTITANHIVLKFQRSNPRRISGFPLEGVIILHKDPPYLIKSSEYIIEFYDERMNRIREVCKLNNTYDKSVPSRLRNMHRTFTALEHSQGELWKQEFNLQLSDDAHLSEADFTLSHYGFPEPFGVEWPKPTPWFLYFSAGGFGLFFLGFFLWRVLAKRQARGAA
jgi:hypothetical protein